MPETEWQGLRGDAARNARRVLAAARLMLREDPEVPAQDIAEKAGLGVATLYRRFPTRDDLVQAVVWDIFTTDIAPALEKAKSEGDPREGLRIAFEAALACASREGPLWVPKVGLDVFQPFVETVSQIVRRAQAENLMRADLDPENDVVRILSMLLSLTPLLSRGGDDWKRYLRLIMDSLFLTSAAPLPPAEALDFYREAGTEP
jgi:AcrR family transcriptional regulator